MINFREKSSLYFKYIYWGIIFVGFALIGASKAIAWGGFTEPLDVHFHIHHEQEKDPEQELQEMMEAADQEREASDD